MCITMNNILITGATGFIGRYLVEQFCQDNNVICLVRPGTKNLNRISEFADKIKIVVTTSETRTILMRLTT